MKIITLDLTKRFSVFLDVTCNVDLLLMCDTKETDIISISTKFWQFPLNIAVNASLSKTKCNEEAYKLFFYDCVFSDRADRIVLHPSQFTFPHFMNTHIQQMNFAFDGFNFEFPQYSLQHLLVLVVLFVGVLTLLLSLFDKILTSAVTSPIVSSHNLLTVDTDLVSQKQIIWCNNSSECSSLIVSRKRRRLVELSKESLGDDDDADESWSSASNGNLVAVSEDMFEVELIDY